MQPLVQVTTDVRVIVLVAVTGWVYVDVPLVIVLHVTEFISNCRISQSESYLPGQVVVVWVVVTITGGPGVSVSEGAVSEGMLEAGAVVG